MQNPFFNLSKSLLVVN